MDTQLVVVLTGLAFLDSLNPFTIAAQAYLLGTPRPMPRSLAFLAGTFAAYLAGGILLLLGWSRILAGVLPLVPEWGVPVAEIVLGLGLGGFALWSARRAAAGTPFTPPQKLSVPATLAFALASTLADLPTALPYFGAVHAISAEVNGLPGRLLAIGWYNLVYCAPLVALVIARLALAKTASERLFGRMRAGIDWAFARLLPMITALIAAGLVADGLRRLQG